MKYAMAIQEILRKVVVIEAESLDDAEKLARERCDSGEIVLGADDLVEDSQSGEVCNIFEADWYDAEEEKYAD